MNLLTGNETVTPPLLNGGRGNSERNKTISWKCFHLFLWLLALFGLDIRPLDDSSLATASSTSVLSVLRTGIHQVLVFGAIFFSGFQAFSHLIIMAVGTYDIGFIDTLSFLNEFRQIIMKSVLTIILVLAYRRRRVARSAINSLEKLIYDNQSSSCYNSKLGPLLIQWTLCLYGIVGAHTAFSFHMVRHFYRQDPARYGGPPVWIPGMDLKSLEPHFLKFIVGLIDSFVYTVYCYGSRLALASLVGMVCVLFRKCIAALNVTIQSWLLRDNDFSAGRRQTQNIPKLDTESVRLVEMQKSMRTLDSLIAINEDLNRAFSGVLLFLFGGGFCIGVLDLIFLALKYGADYVTALEYINKTIIWLPHLLVYLAASGVATESEHTLQLMKRLTRTVELRQSFRDCEFQSNRYRSIYDDAFVDNKMKRGCADHDLLRGSRNTTLLFQARPRTLSTGRQPCTVDVKSDKDDTTNGAHEQEFSMIYEQFNPAYHSRMELTLGGVMVLDERFILRFFASLATFSVMLIQLQPAYRIAKTASPSNCTNLI